LSGEAPPEYVSARRTLLDVLEALKAHLDAIVLVGAQAIYQFTGDSDLPIAEFTTDADLSINPQLLASTPLLMQAMKDANFTQVEDQLRWKSASGVFVDLMVPEALVEGTSRRSVTNLAEHGPMSARRTRGLEASLEDRERKIIQALEVSDIRTFEIWVAGPAALLVAKVIKLTERFDVNDPDRVPQKDALDLFRLMQVIPTAELAQRLNRLLQSEVAAPTTTGAIQALARDFARSDAKAPKLAAQASGLPISERGVLAESFALLVRDLLEVLGPN
jgi:hypothetical protein